VVITGEVVTGKTLLVQALFRELSDRRLATASVAAANLHSETLLPLVASAFGLSHAGCDKVTLSLNLKRLLLEEPNYREGALLVVDEAQTLDASALEEIRMLSNLEVNGRALLQIFLIGQPDLRSTLLAPGMEQMRQRVIASHKLDPLTADETKRYILYRLKAVGWDGDPALSADIYDAVYRWSHGIPRRVNHFMDRTLLYGYLEELHLIDGNCIATVIREMNDELAGAEEAGLVAPAAPTSPRHEEVRRQAPTISRPPEPPPGQELYFSTRGDRVAPSMSARTQEERPDAGGRESGFDDSALERRLAALESKLDRIIAYREKDAPLEDEEIEDVKIVPAKRAGGES
jgi:type II secretory pathway predicted ATPase ExeA